MNEIRLRHPLQWPDRLGWLALGLAGVLCLLQLAVGWFAAGPWEANLFRDDAYYQFAVAKSVALGDGFRLDGVHTAGGVQVLWTLVLAVPGRLFGPASIPFAAAFLGTLLHLLSALLVVRLVLLGAPRVVAWGLAAYFASRPLLVAEALNGQETALAVFALLVWTRRAISLELGVPTSRPGLLVWTLLLPWVRTDLLVFPVGFALWKLVGRAWGAERRPPGANEVALGASLALYVVLQKACFGHWLPVSGLAIPWLFHDAFAATDPQLADTARRYWWFVRPLFLGGPYTIAGFGFGFAVSWLALAPLAAKRRFAPVLVIAIAAILGARDIAAPFLAAVLLIFTSPAARGLCASVAGRGPVGMWIGFFLLLALHLPVRWYPRNYYFVPAAVCGVTTLAAMAAGWLSDRFPVAMVPLSRRISIFWVGLMVLLPLDGSFDWRRFPWQEEMSFAARWAPKIVGEEAGIGAFNTGLLAWHHPGPIRNLDGVVDGASLPALRERRLVRWLRGEGIDYVLDSPRQVADTDPDPIAPHASGRYLGPRGSQELVPLVAFDLPGVEARHPGTDCQMLFGLRGVDPPLLVPAVLEVGEESTVVLLATRDGDRAARYVVERQGRQRPLEIATSAFRAPWVVMRLSGKSGRVLRDGKKVVGW